MSLTINECFHTIYKNSIVAHDDIFGLNVLLYEFLLLNNHTSANIVFGYQYIESKRIAKKHIWVEVKDSYDNTHQLDVLNQSVLLYLRSKESMYFGLSNVKKDLNFFMPFGRDSFSFQASKDQSVLTKYIPEHALIVNKSDPIFPSSFKKLHSLCPKTRQFKVTDDKLKAFWDQHMSPISDIRENLILVKS